MADRGERIAHASDCAAQRIKSQITTITVHPQAEMRLEVISHDFLTKQGYLRNVVISVIIKQNQTLNVLHLRLYKGNHITHLLGNISKEKTN